MGIAKRIVSLRQLHAFHTVARLGSVTRAAAELHLSQSAVSIQIGELEASIGAPAVACASPKPVKSCRAMQIAC